MLSSQSDKNMKSNKPVLKTRKINVAPNYLYSQLTLGDTLLGSDWSFQQVCKYPRKQLVESNAALFFRIKKQYNHCKIILFTIDVPSQLIRMLIFIRCHEGSKIQYLRKAFFKWHNNNFFLSLHQTTHQWWRKDNATKLLSLWYLKDHSCFKFRCNTLNCSSCTKISSRISNGIGGK